MAITEVKNLINRFSISEQLQLAMYILENVSKEREQEEWLTPVVEKELNRRAKEALSNKNTLLSHEEVMVNLH